jgi:peptide/nickel transport system substrate-binding protein
MRRRDLALLPGLAIATPSLAAPALAQGDTRPALTVAVQKLSNSNTLETPREQSNVGFRLSTLYAESLIGTDWLGDLSAKPELATAWRRVDDRTLEFALRPGVRMHDGRVMTAEDVAFSLGGARLFGTTSAGEGRSVTITAGQTGASRRRSCRHAPAHLSGAGAGRGGGRERGPLRQPRARRDAGRSHRAECRRGAVPRRLRRGENWLAWSRRPIGTGPLSHRRVPPRRLADLRSA